MVKKYHQNLLEKAFSLAEGSRLGWEFESYAKEFLVAINPSIETRGGSKDGGIDAKLDEIYFQISVEADWKNKIQKTLKRYQENGIKANHLILVTSKKIGFERDSIKYEYFKKGIQLEIYDSEWFLSRMYFSEQTENSSIRFIEKVIGPLSEESLVRHTWVNDNDNNMNKEDIMASYTYLLLQRKNKNHNYNLDKVVFNGLVLASLRETSIEEKRKTRKEVKCFIQEVLGVQDDQNFNDKVDSALKRLTQKEKIKHWKKEDEYIIEYKERERIKNELQELNVIEQSFMKELEIEVKRVIKTLSLSPYIEMEEARDRSLRVLEQFFQEKGESIIENLQSNTEMDIQTVFNIAQSDLTENFSSSSSKDKLPTLIATIIENIISNENIEIREHLSNISETYNLIAYLRSSKNVKSAMKKLSEGMFIWLDTTVILPLIADKFVSERERYHEKLFSILNKMNIKLFITEDILEEILHHLETSMNYYKDTNRYNSKTPYILEQFITTGNSKDDFLKAIFYMVGNQSNRRKEDLKCFLKEEYGIIVKSSFNSLELDDFDKKFINRSLEIWVEIQINRREDSNTPEEIIRQLARADSNNFAGIILQRQKFANTIGRNHWWLTNDSGSKQALSKLKKEKTLFPNIIIENPAISCNFLRDHILRYSEDSSVSSIPIINNINYMGMTFEELNNITNTVRKEREKYPERILKREIRNEFDEIRVKKKNDIHTDDLVEYLKSLTDFKLF